MASLYFLILILFQVWQQVLPEQRLLCGPQSMGHLQS